MRSFILKLLLLLLAVVVTIRMVIVYGLYNSSNYIYCITDKVNRAKSLPSPKVLFIGGSGTAYGIDARILQDSLRKPVINMGVHGGFGMSLCLHEAELIANKGDIIILSFEYTENDDEVINGEDRIKARAYNAIPGIYSYLTWREKFDYLRLAYFYFEETDKEMYVINTGITKPPYALKLISRIYNVVIPQSHNYTVMIKDIGLRDKPEEYSRSSFDTIGDMNIQFFRSPCKRIGGSIQDYNEGYAKEVQMMNEFYEKMSLKGIRTYYLFSSIAESQYKHSKAMIDTIERGYTNSLKVPLLNNAAQAVYKDSLFYDSYYHLNLIGRYINTENVYKYFKSVVKDRCKSSNK